MTQPAAVCLRAHAFAPFPGDWRQARRCSPRAQSSHLELEDDLRSEHLLFLSLILSVLRCF